MKPIYRVSLVLSCQGCTAAFIAVFRGCMRQEVNTYTENCRSKRDRTSKCQVEVQEHRGQDRISGVSRWRTGSIYKSALKKLPILSVSSKQGKRKETLTEKTNLQRERERERERENRKNA